MLLTVVPLLGPIGGGLGLATGAGASSLVSAGGAGAAAAGSSEALTTILPDPNLLEPHGGLNIILVEVFALVTLGATTNAQAAEAILQLAITKFF